MVLMAGGADGTGNILTNAEVYDPVAGTFTLTGSMTVARAVHTATLLSSGQVLIAGGADVNGNALASAELYDPTTGTFSATGSMTAARDEHTATLLSRGEVLIAGGRYYGSDGDLMSLASSELYDPVAGTFIATGTMATEREGHTATLLPNEKGLVGKVLIAGGDDGPSVVESAELWNPGAGTFIATGHMTAARLNHTATLLSNGKVLIAGGDEIGSAELYE
jgi:hypothetical protein